MSKKQTLMTSYDLLAASLPQTLPGMQALMPLMPQEVLRAHFGCWPHAAAVASVACSKLTTV